MAPTLPDLAELLPSWQLAMRAERKAAGTIKTYSDGVTGFLRWCDKTNTPPELTKPTFRRLSPTCWPTVPRPPRRGRGNCTEAIRYVARRRGRARYRSPTRMKQPSIDNKVSMRSPTRNSEG